jgi:hypothetical protein
LQRISCMSALPPKSGHSPSRSACPLCAKSGHRLDSSDHRARGGPRNCKMALLVWRFDLS